MIVIVFSRLYLSTPEESIYPANCRDILDLTSHRPTPVALYLVERGVSLTYPHDAVLPTSQGIAKDDMTNVIRRPFSAVSNAFVLVAQQVVRPRHSK